MLKFGMDFKRMNSPGYLANHMARLFEQGLQKRIKPLGIVPGQFPALLELYEKDGQTQKQLVEKLDVEQATLANTLARMERDGLIVRREHQADGRARWIHLTEKAKSIKDQAHQAAMDTNVAALAALTPDEKQLFIKLIRKTIQNMKDGA